MTRLQHRAAYMRLWRDPRIRARWARRRRWHRSVEIETLAAFQATASSLDPLRIREPIWSPIPPAAKSMKRNWRRRKEENDMKSARIPWTILAVLFLVGATPEHPGHMVKLDRLQVAAADNGRYLQVVAGKVQPSEGVPIPIFVWNASLNPAAGSPVITRDATTGALTFPSAPNPPISLQLHVNGIRQAWGRDFTLNGAVATPGPDQTLPDGRVYSPKGAILAADEIVADYAR